MIEKQFTVEAGDFVHAGQVSSQIKVSLKQLGLSPILLRRIAVASYEAEINMIIHAWGGLITMKLDDDGILTLIFADEGPGIADIEQALVPGWSTAGEEARQLGFGAGMGLVNIRRVSDCFDLQSSPKGTTLTVSFRCDG